VIEKVKIIKKDRSEDLEKAVNSEIRMYKNNILGIQYSAMQTFDRDFSQVVYSAMILFK
jgi:hypothetical protein